MLDVDLVRGKPPLEVEFRVSLVEDLQHAMALVLIAPLYEGFDQWVYATHAALPPDLKDGLNVVLSLLKKPGIFTPLPADDPAHRDFSALLARIAALSEEDFRRSVDVTLDAIAMQCQEKEGREILLPSVDDEDALRAFLGETCETELEESHLDQLVQLIRNPAALKAEFISVVTRFWEQFYREEFERCLPLMERSVNYHRAQNYSADFPTLFNAVTGRLLPEEKRGYQDAEKVIFVPSCHIGPYFTFRAIEETRPTLALIYNCRPTGGPEQEQTPALQDLFPPLKALADETRLQILSMLDGQELYAQQIVERLDISQPAVSRHLRLMVAGGVLSERKEDSMKHYSINENTLIALAERLKGFRGRENLA